MPPRRSARRPPRPPLDPHTLEAHDAPLVADETYDRVVVRDADLTRARAAGSRFLECALVDVDLTEADLSGARFSESVLTRVRGAGIDLSDATLADTVVTDPRLGAPAAYGSVWRDVRVVGGKVDFLNLRGATLTDVVFEDVVLLEPDLAGATLKRVSFDGCQLVTAQFSGVTMTEVDLSGARLVVPRGLASLRGATISRLQLLDLADALADQLGIRIGT